MDSLKETTSKDGSVGGYFSKINFGGAIRSPAASTKPQVSPNGGLTTILSNSSQTSVAAPTTASGSTPSIKAPGLYRKVSSSFLKQPKARLRTSSFGAQQILEPAHKYDSLESITSQRKRSPIPTFRDPTAQEPRGSVSELSPTTTIDAASAEPRNAVVEAEGAAAGEMEMWAQATYRPDPKMFLNATAGGEKQRSGSIAGLSMHSGSMPSAQAPANAPNSPSIEALTFSHIQEIASKRIATLDYLRKAHEGRVYWFQTLLFTKADLNKFTSFEQRRLARRATSYLLLGVSLPTILDLNSSNALDFLRSLNALLAEFEAYQHNHPVDGSASSLSRARIPQMFKRAASSTGKARRTSSAADIGLPLGSTTDLISLVSGHHTPSGITLSSFPASSDSDLLPGEEYSLLLTPSLPFDPDFYEVFATLCDVLIDCYTKLLELVRDKRECTVAVAELFQKADSKVRKIIVGGISKEFEEHTRAGVKTEIAGIGKVVLGGLV